MKQTAVFISLLLFCVFSLKAQENSTLDVVQHLDEVELFSKRIKDSVYTTNQIVLTDSVLKRSQASLTHLLNFNSTVYLKENGLGMVSSPSFRGTTAQQTAVLWNGININSQTTGQTDFNTISTQGFDKVVVKPGGGGSVDGSNAIGGTIYLENNLAYNKGYVNELFLKYGEFKTYGVNYKTSYSDAKTGVALSVSNNGSDNDYPYLGTDRKNENGQYHNINIGFTGGVKLDNANTIKIYSNVYKGRRNFSLPTPNALKTKYNDFNTRSMLEWSHAAKHILHQTKVAFLTERYEYFPNIDSDYYTFGNVESLVVKSSLDYRLKNTMLLTGGVNYTNNNGKGSNIQQEQRQMGAVSLGLKHKLGPLFYEVSLRQELNQNYDSPFLYALGLKALVTHFYNIKLNASKNFRIPTYNDLYWQGLGDPNLKPELSYQAEMSHILDFKNLSFTLTGYYNDIDNLLSWVPDSSGVWRPENTESVGIYGVEALLNAEKKIRNHYFNVSATYAYTRSKNKKTNKQLIYVPYHKLTTAFAYNYKKWSAYYQYINNGEVFTTTDNAIEHIVNSYMVANLGLEYNWSNPKTNIVLGMQALNLWNESYESVMNRPFPGRNYNAYINFNF